MLRFDEIPLPPGGPTHINAAPDVVERVRRSPHCGGETAEGTPLLHGLPVHTKSFFPPRFLQVLQNDILLKSDWLGDEEAPARERPAPLLPAGFRPR